MISIGDRAEDMQARNPEIWQKIAERVAVISIYDPRLRHRNNYPERVWG